MGCIPFLWAPVNTTWKFHNYARITVHNYPGDLLSLKKKMRYVQSRDEWNQSKTKTQQDKYGVCSLFRVEGGGICRAWTAPPRGLASPAHVYGTSLELVPLTACGSSWRCSCLLQTSGNFLGSPSQLQIYSHSFMHFPLWGCPQGVQSSRTLPALQKALGFQNITFHTPAKPGLASSSRSGQVSWAVTFEWLDLGKLFATQTVQVGCPRDNSLLQKKSLSDELTFLHPIMGP